MRTNYILYIYRFFRNGVIILKSHNEDSRHNYYCGIDITNLTLIGEGRQGKVYLLPNDKVIKVFKRKESCEDQLFILQQACKSSYFTKVYNYDAYSIIIDFVQGVPLNIYLGSNSLSKKLSLELANLIITFEKLGFTRLDIRICHIFVQADESIKIIDPRGSFKIIEPYPRLMIKGLKKYNALDNFFKFIQPEYKDICLNWKNLFEMSNL